MAYSDIGIKVVVMGVAEAHRQLGAVRNDLNRVGGDIKTMSGGVSQFGASMMKAGDLMVSFGRTLTFAVTAPIIGLNTALIVSGIQFEQAFADIKKTVDGVSIGFEGVAKQMYGTADGLSEAQKQTVLTSGKMGELTKVGSKLYDQFRELSLVIPISASELANVGAIAGQLGVPAGEILQFTKLMAMMGTATNLSAEQAATSIAKFANIMGISDDQIAEFAKHMGSSVVALGNKAASTESEIVNMSMRLAAAGRMAGLSSQEILGLSTSLADMGVRAELGGTALSRLLYEMIFAISDGGDALTAFTDVVGLSAADFSASFKRDAVGTMELFLSRLADLQDQGDVSKQMLIDMGLSGVRVRDVMGRLGPNMKLVRDNIALANVAWGDSIALEEEFYKQTDTISNQLKLLRNDFQYLGQEIFALVREDLVNLINFGRKLITMFTDLDAGTKKMILRIGLIAAAVGPLLLALGTVVQLAGIAAKGAALLAAGLNPITIAIAAVVGAVIVFREAWSKNWLGIGDAINPVVDTIKYIVYWLGEAFKFGEKGGGIFGGIAASLRAVFYIFKDQKTTFFSKLFQAFGMSKDQAEKFGLAIVHTVAPAVNKLIAGFNRIKLVANTVMATFKKEGLMAALKLFFGGNMIEQILSSFGTGEGLSRSIGDMFRSILIPALKGDITGLLEGLWESLKVASFGITDWLESVLPVIIAKLMQWGQAFVDWIAPYVPLAVDNLSNLAGNIFNWIKEKVPVVIDQLGKWGKAFIDWIGPIIPPLLGELLVLVSKLVTWVGKQLSIIGDKLKEWGQAFIDWVVPAAADLLLALPGVLADVIKWILDVTPDIVAQLLEWATAFVGWVLPMIGDLVIELAKIWAAIAFWIATEFIPSIVAELPGIAEAFIGFVYEMITKVGPKLWEFITTITSYITDTMVPEIVNGALAIGQALLDGIKKGLDDGWDVFTQYLEDKIGGGIIGDFIDFMGVGSPAKIMIPIGQSITQGIALGMSDLSSIQDAMSGVGQVLLSPRMIQASAGGAGGDVNNSRTYSPTIYGAPMNSPQDTGYELLRTARILGAVG